MLPQTDKIDPRGIKNRAETAQGAPRSAHERQRAPQERPRAAQERPKSAPRASQERPRAPQEHPRAPQEPLKSVQRRPRESSGHHFEASQLEKAAFEGDPSRDSVEKRVRNDFRSIFASCAQARTCEKPVKTLGFYRFYACRLFFERVGLLVQRSIEKALKSALLSTPNRPKIDQNRSSEPFSSQFDRQSRSKQPRKANRQANRAARASQTRPIEQPDRAGWLASRAHSFGLVRSCKLLLTTSL